MAIFPWIFIIILAIGIIYLVKKIVNAKRLIKELTIRENKTTTQLSAIKEKLHNDVGHQLLLLEKSATPNQKPLLQEVQRIVRDLAHGIRTSIVEEIGLENALILLCKQVENHTDFVIIETIAIKKSQINSQQSQDLFSIIEELINNSLKHCNGRRIKLNITVSDAGVDLRYQDYSNKEIEAISNQETEGIGKSLIAEKVKKWNWAYSDEMNENGFLATLTSV